MERYFLRETIRTTVGLSVEEEEDLGDGQVSTSMEDTCRVGEDAGGLRGLEI